MIYLDHNATTPVRPEALEAMLPFLKGEYGNPNSAYFLGQRARKAVEEARERLALLVGAADPQEIVFTSCGTESDVMALCGAAWSAYDASGGRRRRVVVSRVEHEAVRGAAQVLAARGFEIAWAGVDGEGRVPPEAARALIDERTAVVSIMHANNEVGSLQPVAEIARAAREAGAFVHTDAVQSAGKVALDVRSLGVDLLSLSGHKFYAPKGVAALYVRRGVRLAPVITGHQEKNRRGGTENVAGIAALGRAAELALAELGAKDHEALRRRLVEGALALGDARVNGPADPALRLPQTAHLSFKGLDGHHLVVALDQKGICVSSGPACSTGASEPSHVVTAMGVARDYASGSLRVSFGRTTAAADVDALLQALREAVPRLRQPAARP